MSAGFVPSQNPCCGIHAVAEATELPFETVWNVAAFSNKKKASWKGRSSFEDRLTILDRLDAIHSEDYSLAGKTLIEACFLASQVPYVNFTFDISGHVLSYKNGKLTDQYGTYCPTKYHKRFSYVARACRVHPVRDFDEEKLWEKLADPLDYL